ncbi:acyltransferase family protein [Amaricoccus sp. W119]|uniref:acyltransferase family protein n=1 Tax=Amaricoccus sp. W119 TaxID=3391833 RepID=UPI0039A6E94F
MIREWAGKSLMELASSPRGADRIAWADIAKAFSIILLVVWTVYGLDIYFDHMFILARMPMFFFVSGLFGLGVITRSSMPNFFKNKVGNLVYLYVLWGTLWFLTTELVAYLWWGRDMAPEEIATMLWEPLAIIWFFYGLALAFGVAYLCREAPVWIVFAVSMLAYVIVVAQGSWLSIPVLEKVIRLFPYFWLGLVLRPLVSRLVNAYWQFWPIPMACFLALSYWIMQSPWQQFGPLTFAVTICGIAALLGLAAHAAQYEWSWVLKLIGGSTLYIYALDHIVIFYMERVMGKLGNPVYEQIVMVPVVVIVGTVVGRFCARRESLRWLFSAPWAPYKPPSRVERPGQPLGASGISPRRREV